MKIGKAITALKNGESISRSSWEQDRFILEICSGVCPENSGKVQDFIEGVSINLFNISTSENTDIMMPDIILVDNYLKINSTYQLSTEDILAEDWFKIKQ